MIDDFWGPDEWSVFVQEIGRVLPGRPIYEIPTTHPVFNNVYDIANVIQVPNIRTGQMHGMYGTPTHEGRGSEVPHVYGIDDDPRRTHRADQLEHRPGRRMGVGGESVLSTQVLDLRV